MQQSLSHVISQVRKHGFSQRLLFLVSFMLFFFGLFVAVLEYIIPISIIQAGIDKATMGFIIGFSSIAGALFDFLLSKFLQNTHFRRVYMLMFAFSFIYPLLLWQAKGVWLYLLAMTIWGIFYDLENFGNFDFVGRKAEESDRASHFGIIFVFKSLACLLAPLIAGFLVGEVVGFAPFLFSWIILGISFVCFLVLLVVSRKKRLHEPEEKSIKPVNVVKELYLWKVIGKELFFVLLLTIILNCVDGFFWTIGPIFSGVSFSQNIYNGLFLTAYEFPAIIIGWFIGRITNKVGKKKTAFLSLLFGGILLLFLPFLHNEYLVLILVFCSSFFFSLAWPSINGAYADYISEAMRYEKEIAGLEDFSTNIGYIIGPIFAGFLAEKYGNAASFSVLAVSCIICGVFLFFLTPRSIKVKV